MRIDLPDVDSAAKEAGFGVVFITHNPHHVLLVGDDFVLLNRGRQKLDCSYDDITFEHLTQEMALAPNSKRCHTNCVVKARNWGLELRCRTCECLAAG